MPKAVRGTLIECDASIKAIIMNIDSERHDFVIEDLDEEHVLVKQEKLNELKQRLKEALRDTVRDTEESGSE